MTPTTAGPLRLARAGIVAGAVLGLAAGAHRMGGGSLPGPLAILALGAVLLALTTALAGRRLTTVVLALVLGGGQFALHWIFDALAPMGCAPVAAAGPAPPALAHLGHAAGTMLTCGGMQRGPAVPQSSEVLQAHAAGSPAMLLAHVLATLATVLVIASGERTLWWLLTWLRPLVQAPARPEVRVVVRRGLVRLPAVVRARRAVYLRTSPRRGPPRTPAPAAAFA
ncbi:hypothetical protein [Pengzhenrongella sp.]|uniref:hypothetical protein n=1 Tax=Pengzhenrongella sp. TaxID=2888820 RepID=UPI002F95EA30